MSALRRALVAQIAFSQSTTKRVVLYPTALLAQSYSTKQPRKAKAADAVPPSALEPEAVVWPRPSEIPFQVKVANSVNLIGRVDSPVQFQSSADGKHWAGTVISQKASFHSPQLWIPVVFEGDLAHIAACHLKKNDHVHISGQLTADPPPLSAIHQANVQVMARGISFIELSSQTKRNPIASEKQEDSTTYHSAGTRKVTNLASDPWRDVLDNPEKWWDYRSQKLNGSVNPRHPDFKRKGDGLALWLNKASGSVLTELEKLEFDVQTPRSKYAKLAESDVKTPKFKKAEQVKVKGVEPDVQTPESKFVRQKKGDESWKDLMENPNKWWDNRLDKLSNKSPDFKHKETGEVLWLSSAPAWVLSKLPAPVKSKKTAAIGKRETLLS